MLLGDQVSAMLYVFLESCLKTDHDVDCQPFICHLRHPCSGEQILFGGFVLCRNL